MDSTTIISGRIVDVVSKRIFEGSLEIQNGKIQRIIEEAVEEKRYILPGFIDAHIHIESSMLVPSEFARLAIVHGTVATVSDPHEIANVMGVPGVDYMINNGRQQAFKFFFGAPSCVPATPFESSGASLDANAVETLLQGSDIYYLSEMMNYPGVVFHDAEVIKKLEAARRIGKPIDGHAPGLRGQELKKYVEAGITTDHECFDIDEAREKAGLGMHILIREGSAAKNFDTLIPLINEIPDQIMFCSDDRHPDDLVKGHINELVNKALKSGYDLFSVLRACTLHPVKYYGLNVGLLQEGDDADFIFSESLSEIIPSKVFIKGELLADNGVSLIPAIGKTIPNNFFAEKLKIEDLLIRDCGKDIRVIHALDGQLITKSSVETPLRINNTLNSDIERDILKMLVMNRYQKAKPAFAFIKNFKLERGAIASSVAHDSHNIVAVGADDISLMNAVNKLIDCKGGIAFADGEDVSILPLPVGGIMSDKDGPTVARLYQEIDRKVKMAGSDLKAPFMTLSFMSLLVIPELKLSDKGLFDGSKFEFVSLFTD